VEGRDKAKRRKYYRRVDKEKLHLVESNIGQELVEAVCRYLAEFNKKAGDRIVELLLEPPTQLKLDFSYPDRAAPNNGIRPKVST